MVHVQLLLVHLIPNAEPQDTQVRHSAKEMQFTKTTKHTLAQILEQPAQHVQTQQNLRFRQLAQAVKFALAEHAQMLPAVIIHNAEPADLPEVLSAKAMASIKTTPPILALTREQPAQHVLMPHRLS